MIYLASPHSHPSAFVREKRYLQAMEYTAYLLQQGIFVYSPIVHTHEISKLAQFPADFAFFSAYDFDMLKRCDELRVLMLEDWHFSKGVQAEIRFAQENHIKVTFATERNIGGWCETA